MILAKHPYSPEAWYEVAQGKKSPDKRIKVERVTEIPDRCALTFTYHSELPPEAALVGGLAISDRHGDFYVGTKPRIARVFATATDGGSRIAVEWHVSSPAAVYRAATHTLYVCVPGLVKPQVLRDPPRTHTP